MCDYESKSQSTLRTHTKRIHERADRVEYPCNQCIYKSFSVHHLKVHTQSLHEGKRYLCDKCPYQVTTSGSLGVHIKTVNAGFVYSCKECDFFFRGYGRGLAVKLRSGKVQGQVWSRSGPGLVQFTAQI